MKKRLLFDAVAREGILRGATLLADAVRVTLGPRSRCVLIDTRWGAPIVCNDGVTIAKALEDDDPMQSLGIRMIREAAERTANVVGDGTTTATLLAHAILAAGVADVAAGASAIELKRGLDRGLRAAVASIRALSRPVTTRREKAQVATISAHNDAALGDLVAEAVERVGGEGVVSVDEAEGAETRLEVVEGMQLDRGYLSPHFVTDAGRMECVLEDALVLLSERRISAMEDLVSLLEEIVKIGRPLLVVAEDVEGEALAMLVLNERRGTIHCAAVKAPGYGARRTAMLEDLAILTGGRVVPAAGSEPPAISELGTARRIVVARDTTTVIGGGGRARAVQDRAERLRREILQATSEFDREKLQERLARLAGGVAVIHVGAPTEAELKSRKEALDDAIRATQAAVAEGIVPGGGLALLRAISAVEREEATCAAGERAGLRVLAHALAVPARQIAQNSDEDGAAVVQRMRSGDGNQGFDAALGRWVDLVEEGIVDPTKVVRIALENAVSVASVLLLTKATLAERPARRAGASHA
jgi:chaperonin GroEL